MDCYLNEINNDVLCQNGMNSSIILNFATTRYRFDLSWDVYKSLNCQLKIKVIYKKK